jgi:hypothetical protein
MATPAEIQTQIDLTAPTTKITHSYAGAGTIDDHYVVGGQAPHAARDRWVQTTAAQTAAQQAAVILAAMLP